MSPLNAVAVDSALSHGDSACLLIQVVLVSCIPYILHQKLRTVSPFRYCQTCYGIFAFFVETTYLHDCTLA